VTEGDDHATSDRRIRLAWIGVALISLMLLGILALLWNDKNNRTFNTQELTDHAAVESYLDENWATRDEPDAAELPTGVSYRASASSQHRMCTCRATSGNAGPPR
jgi:hypothetical protein